MRSIKIFFMAFALCATSVVNSGVQAAGNGLTQDWLDATSVILKTDIPRSSFGHTDLGDNVIVDMQQVPGTGLILVTTVDCCASHLPRLFTVDVNAVVTEVTPSAWRSYTGQGWMPFNIKVNKFGIVLFGWWQDDEQIYSQVKPVFAVLDLNFKLKTLGPLGIAPLPTVFGFQLETAVVWQDFSVYLTGWRSDSTNYYLARLALDGSNVAEFNSGNPKVIGQSALIGGLGFGGHSSSAVADNGTVLIGVGRSFLDASSAYIFDRFGASVTQIQSKLTNWFNNSCRYTIDVVELVLPPNEYGDWWIRKSCGDGSIIETFSVSSNAESDGNICGGSHMGSLGNGGIFVVDRKHFCVIAEPLEAPSFWTKFSTKMIEIPGNLYGYLYQGFGAAFQGSTAILTFGSTEEYLGIWGLNIKPNPSTLSSITPGNQSVTATWTAATSNSIFPTTRYTVTSTPGGKTCTTTLTFTCTITGLTNGTTYSFTVTSENAAGTGESTAMSGTPGASPGAMAAPVATPGDSRMSISWVAPSTNGYAIDQYEVQSSPSGFSCTPSTTSCDITGLSNGTSYQFKVRAHNQLGYSDWSAWSVAQSPTPSIAVPQKPRNVSATLSGLEATVTWNTPTSDGGSAITGYLVTSSPGGKQCSTNQLTCLITGLSRNTAYTFTVIAINIIGNSQPSDPSTGQMTANSPGQVQSVTAKVSSKTVSLSWLPPTSTGGSTITGYRVSVRNSNLTCLTTVLTCKVTGLTNGTTYEFQIYALNAVGATEIPVSVYASPVPIKPSAPTKLSSKYISSGKWQITWSGAKGNGPAITSYKYRYADSKSLKYSKFVLNKTKTSALLSGLKKGRSYIVEIEVATSDGTASKKFTLKITK